MTDPQTPGLNQPLPYGVGYFAVIILFEKVLLEKVFIKTKSFCLVFMNCNKLQCKTKHNASIMLFTKLFVVTPGATHYLLQ